MRILLASTWDNKGGAARVAWNLHRGLVDMGHDSHMAVGHKASDDERVRVIPERYALTLPQRALQRAGRGVTRFAGGWPGSEALSGLLHRLGEDPKTRDRRLGHEDFNFPGTSELLDLAPTFPDVVNCHNLHGNFFDLRILPQLSRRVPLVLSLHDAWLLAGHCAHALDCDLWESGCQPCPDISIYHALERDGSADNWRIKRRIFEQSRLYVVTACQWLMSRVERSILAPALAGGRVIPTGVDLTALYPVEKKSLRQKMGVDPDAAVLLFVAGDLKKNLWKDYATIEKAVSIVGELAPDRPIVFFALGGYEEGVQQVGNAQVVLVPYMHRFSRIVRYFQMADIYLHAARADTFPNVVVEALACGTPVVATAVCGICEQVKSRSCPGADPGQKSWGPDEATGVLTPPASAEGMAQAVAHLLKEPELLARLSDNAARTARQSYSLDGQVKDYLSFYRQVREDHGRHYGL